MNEEKKDSVLQESAEYITEKEARAVKELFQKYLKSYKEKESSMTDKEWLEQLFVKEIPQKSKDEASQEAEEIVETIQTYDKNLASVNEAASKGVSSEAWLADKIQEIFERGIIQTEALNFIRGRSIAKTYLIIDEAQNMTPNQVRGIITRAGKGTKIILLGDPCQIDRPFLDERTNGLSYAAKYMQGSPYCAQLTLSAEECERSVLAMDAVKRL